MSDDLSRNFDAHNSGETEPSGPAMTTSAQAVAALTGQTVGVGRPPAGETVVVQTAPGDVFAIEFNPAEAQVAIKDGSLILGFENGGSLIFENLLEAAASSNEPIFQVGEVGIGSTLLLGQALALAGGTTLETAAGIQTVSQSGGGTVYSDDLGQSITLLTAQGTIPPTDLEFGLIDLGQVTNIDPVQGTVAVNFESLVESEGPVNGTFGGGFEDWQPNQNVGDSTSSPMRLVVTLDQPAGDDEVSTSLLISGLPAGVKLFIGGTDAGDEVPVPPGGVTVLAGDLDQIYILPPADSDADIPLTVTATVLDPSDGIEVTLAPVQTVAVVDAAADLPELSIDCSFGKLTGLEGFAFSIGGKEKGSEGSSTASHLYKIDLATGEATDIGIVSSKNIDVEGLALSSRDGMLYGASTQNPAGLVKIDPETADATFFPVDQSVWRKVEGMAFDGSSTHLFAVTDTSPDKLYSVSLEPGSEGETTLIGTLDIDAGLKIETIAIHPVTGKAYVTAGKDDTVSKIFEIDLSDGSIIASHWLQDGGLDVPNIEGLSFDSNGTLWGFQSQGGGIFTIDPATGESTFVADSLGVNDLTNDLESLAIGATNGECICGIEESHVYLAVAASFSDTDGSEAHSVLITGVPRDWNLLTEGLGDDSIALVDSNPGSDFVSYLVTVNGGSFDATLEFDPQNWTSTHLDNGDTHDDGPAEIVVTAISQELNELLAGGGDLELTLVNNTASVSQTKTVDIKNAAVQDAEVQQEEPVDYQPTANAVAAGAVLEANLVDPEIDPEIDVEQSHGNLDFDFGGDGAGSISNIVFTSAVDPENGSEVPLTVDGESVTFGSAELSGGFLMLTGKALVGGVESDILTIKIDPASGEYWVILHHAIDHPDAGEAGADDPLSLFFDYTVSDADGDTATAKFEVNVQDSNVEARWTGAKTIDEADLGDPEKRTVTGTLKYNFGADLAGLVIGLELNEVKDSESGEAFDLSVDGKPVSFAPAIAADGTLTLVGTADVGGVETDIITVAVDQASGAYSITLHHTIDHPNIGATGADDSLRLRFRYTVQDADGDTESATLRLHILDDETLEVAALAFAPEAVVGGDGDDELSGGDGSQILTGGLGADTFVFELGESGVDTITDYSLNEGDSIDISDLVQGTSVDQATIDSFVRVDSGTGEIQVSTTGNAADFSTIAIIGPGGDDVRIIFGDDPLDQATISPV